MKDNEKKDYENFLQLFVTEVVKNRIHCTVCTLSPITPDTTPRRRSERLRRRSGSADVNDSQDNSTSSSSDSSIISPAATASRPTTRSTKRPAEPTSTLSSSSSSSSSSPPPKDEEAPSTKRARSKSPNADMSPAEIVDLPVEEASDSRKFALISQYLQDKTCIYEKALGLTSLQKLHTRICKYEFLF